MRKLNMVLFSIFVFGLLFIFCNNSNSNTIKNNGNSEKKAENKTVNNSQPTSNNFSLSYSKKVSSHSIRIKITISEKGECTYKKSQFDKEKQNFTYKLPEKDFSELIDTFINEFKFFSLSENVDPKYRSIKDANICYITINYNGKTHKIGGYYADNSEEFEHVFDEIYRLQKIIIENHTITKSINIDKLYIGHYYSTDKMSMQFTINKKGICTYQYYDKSNPKNNKSYICKLIKDDLQQIVYKIDDDLKYFELQNEKLTNYTGTNKYPKVFVIEYNDKRLDLYAYTKDKDEYQPVFKYFDRLIDEMKTKASKPMDKNANENFSLEYIENGSMFPVFIELKISSDGTCHYSRKLPSFNNKPASHKEYEYKLTKKEFTEIVNTMINKFDFYNTQMIMDKESEMMDSNTYKLTINYKGKIHRIGGYDSYDFPKFKPIFKYVEGIIKQVEAKGTKIK